MSRKADGSLTVTDGASMIALPALDFQRLSFRSNLVLRWEWLPGSTAFFVWQLELEPQALPDRIVLYRQAILFEWIELGEDLGRLVQNVVVHEIAHHFGFSDEDMERIENESD